MPGPAQPFAHGNPTGGRPKKTDEMRRAEELMRSRSEDGARDLIKLSEESEDDQVRAKLLIYRMDRVFGKPVQAITGAEGEPLLPAFDVGGMNDADLGALVRLARIAAATATGLAGGTGSEGDGGVGETGAAVAPDRTP